MIQTLSTPVLSLCMPSFDWVPRELVLYQLPMVIFAYV